MPALFQRGPGEGRLVLPSCSSHRTCVYFLLILAMPGLPRSPAAFQALASAPPCDGAISEATQVVNSMLQCSQVQYLYFKAQIAHNMGVLTSF